MAKNKRLLFHACVYIRERGIQSVLFSAEYPEISSDKIMGIKMLITIHNIVLFIHLFIYLGGGCMVYLCNYKLCMESHCVLAAFSKTCWHDYFECLL